MKRIRALSKAIWGRRYVRYPLIAFVVLLVAAVTFIGTFIYLFLPIIPAADYPEPANLREAQRQDLEYFRTYPQYDRSFSENRKRETFEAYVDSLKDRSGTFTEAEFELAVARGVALADNGHSNIDPAGRSRRLNRLPIRFAQFDEGFYVLHATEEHAGLLGARIDSMGSMAMQEIVALIERYTGGLPDRAHYFAPVTLNSPATLHALGIGERSEGLSVAFTLAGGETATHLLEALPPNGIAHPTGRALYAYSSRALEGERWISLMANKEPPIHLEEVDVPFDHRPLAKGYYVRIDANQDRGDYTLAPFIRTTLDAVRAHAPAFVVVDLRVNNGGTTTLKDFAQALLALVDGPIYVVTSAGTFSYGIATAVLLKYHGGDRVVIVGEPVGDRLRFWANGGTTFRLPNSRIAFRAWSSLEDYADGCWHWRDCFWFSPFFRHPGLGELTLDVLVQPSFGSYREGRDTAVDAIQALQVGLSRPLE